MTGGINTGTPAEFGTLGAIALDNSTGEAVMISCAHVYAAPLIKSWNVGTHINNPADNPGHMVGSLKKVSINNMDAAVATLTDQQNYTCGMIDSRIGSITGSRTELEVQKMANSHVKKVGIRTGFTTGIIDDVHKAVGMRYQVPNIEIQLTGQIVIHPDSGSVFSDEGDSGSCIVDDSGKIVGLLIGGDGGFSYATPIERVLKEFDISICPS